MFMVISMGFCNKWLENYGQYHYFLFRVLVGLMFFLHGYGKLFGAKAVTLMSFMGLAGVLELLIGLGVLVGFLTRLAAFGGSIVMLVAYFKVHAFTALSPLANGGELAVMYFVAFLVQMKYGNGKWNLEQPLLKKETF